MSRGPAAPRGHAKHRRHCRLIRMLNWPARSPPRASNLLLGKARAVAQRFPVRLSPRTRVRYPRHHTPAVWYHMGSFNVRDLPAATHKALRIRAARNGRSMEAEVRAILTDAVNPRNSPGLGSMLAAIGHAFGAV